jgi:hypothetical protein
MRPYVTANPSVGSTGAMASYRAGMYTRGPNLADAHVPASAVPPQRIAPDARAMSYARPVAAGSIRSYNASTPRPSAGQYRASPTFQAGARPVEVPRPETRSFSTPAVQAPSPGASPSFTSPVQRSGNPAFRSAPNMQPRSSPSIRAAPSVRGGRGR